MATSQNANGPASLAGDPDRGSNHASEDKEMNSTTNSTAAAGAAMPVDDRDLGDAHTIIHRARHLHELIFMAGESLSDRAMANAFTTGADMLEDMLIDAANIIEMVMASRTGGAA